MLKLEAELVDFVTTKEDPKPPHLVLPPRSSYQRLIAYRLSARFKLQKATPVQEKEAIGASGMAGVGQKAAAAANGGACERMNEARPLFLLLLASSLCEGWGRVLRRSQCERAWLIGHDSPVPPAGSAWVLAFLHALS